MGRTMSTETSQEVTITGAPATGIVLTDVAASKVAALLF